MNLINNVISFYEKKLKIDLSEVKQYSCKNLNDLKIEIILEYISKIIEKYKNQKKYKNYDIRYRFDRTKNKNFFNFEVMIFKNNNLTGKIEISIFSDKVFIFYKLFNRIRKIEILILSIKHDIEKINKIIEKY